MLLYGQTRSVRLIADVRIQIEGGVGVRLLGTSYAGIKLRSPRMIREWVQHDVMLALPCPLSRQ